MKVKHILKLAPLQDEYRIVQDDILQETSYFSYYINKVYGNKRVIAIYGYNADGYDGLEIVIK